MVFLARRFSRWGSLFLLLILPGIGWAETEREIESRLKTEFIERFTQFIAWPREQAAGETFVIGVYGQTPLVRDLRELVRRQTFKDRPGEFVQLSEPRQAAECDVVFIADSAAPELGKILAGAAGKPILTVGDTPGFAERGVLINFVRRDNHLRFEVNTAAIEESGLQFSSRLLRLATLVEPETN